MTVLSHPRPHEVPDPDRCAARLVDGLCTRQATTLVVFDVDDGNPWHHEPGRKTTRLCALCTDEALAVVRDLFDPAAYLVPRSRWSEVLPSSG